MFPAFNNIQALSKVERQVGNLKTVRLRPRCIDVLLPRTSVSISLFLPSPSPIRQVWVWGDEVALCDPAAFTCTEGAAKSSHQTPGPGQWPLCCVLFPGACLAALLVCLLSYLSTQRAFLLLQKRMSVARFVSLPSSFPFFSFCFCSHHLPAQPDHKGVRTFAIVTSV